MACDGSTYNRADYPALANHLVTNFSDLVGDGSTTFKVPDLRGEFLRGTGTNAHTNQGSGAAVGIHQDGTLHVGVSANGTSALAVSQQNVVTPTDYDYVGYNRKRNINTGSSNVDNDGRLYTARPTNTSILYCIKY